MGMESRQTKIGIIGAGKLGTVKAGRLIKVGRAVMLSFSRDLEGRRRLLRSHTRRSPALHGRRERDRGRWQFRRTDGVFLAGHSKHVHRLAPGLSERCRAI
jgi:hypothetical protein